MAITINIAMKLIISQFRNTFLSTLTPNSILQALVNGLSQRNWQQQSQHLTSETQDDIALGKNTV